MFTHCKEGFDCLTKPHYVVLHLLVQVEKSNGHFLFICGEADQNVPAVEGARLSIQKLQSHNKNNYEFLSYPGAGHLLEPPYQPVGTRDIYNVPLGMFWPFLYLW